METVLVNFGNRGEMLGKWPAERLSSRLRLLRQVYQGGRDESSDLRAESRMGHVTQGIIPESHDLF